MLRLTFGIRVVKAKAKAWDEFLAGPENALALAGASAMAQGGPGAPTLLILHGPAGSGKSRLLDGIVLERMERRPGGSLASVTGEAFASACSDASEHPEGWAELRSRFRGVDLFAIDDIHAVSRNKLALTELGHTLDVLEERGAAVVATARLGPGQWSGWPLRLVNRFLGGLSIKVVPPALATRRRHTIEQSRAKGVPLTSESIEALARAAEGFRTLDGWLTSLALMAKVERGPLGIQQVEAFLKGEVVAQPPTLEVVARGVAERFGVTIRDLKGPTRRASVVEPRHLAMFLAREASGLSFASIGAFFGGRDPKTVSHGCRSAEARLAVDPAFHAVAEAIRRAWAYALPTEG